MGLEAYRRRRDFGRTPEPRGAPPRRDAGRSFVVQKHGARRLHYDLRLELGGVLKSWAVPKGPSADPGERRLAIRVEDHPLEYGGFEGVIPEGEYGAGPVVVWDRGRWIPSGDPEEGLRRGRLKFRLEGERLRGGWVLVRSRRAAGGEDGREEWLLVKEPDTEARPGEGSAPLAAHPGSVLTGRSLDEVEADRDRVWTRGGDEARPAMPAAADPAELPGSRPGPLPRRIAPQLAVLVEEAPPGDDWIHELKLDGYRLLCRLEDGEAVLLTRRGEDWTDRFPRIASQVSRLPARRAYLDGEVVALLPDGRSSFGALQEALSRRRTEALLYYAFDLLHLDGLDLTKVELIRRKLLLHNLLASATSDRSSLRYSDHVEGRGPEFLRGACELGVEGIVSKRRAAAYRPGRGRDWRKVKCAERQEFVVGGWTEPGGGRKGFGSLLLGLYDEGGTKLRYVGRVGTGFTERVLAELSGVLAGLERAEPPFENPPAGREAAGVHWVEPRLVVEVAFTGWTKSGVLRHPSFQGVREDRPARSVVREERVSPSPPRPGGGGRVAGVRLTNPDRVLYPEAGLTKRDLAGYYAAVADRLLALEGDRPLTLVRCPEGWRGECFFQKHEAAGVPGSVRRVRLAEADGEDRTYLAVDSPGGLVALVQMGVLEIHTWGARRDRPERPDRMVVDLDPDPAVPWDEVVAGALAVRARLEELGLRSFVKTTGGKGLHVTAPLLRRHGWPEVKAFAAALAGDLARREPARFTARLSKARRRGKIFLDHLRNARGATAVAAYSTRARAGAPVSAPLTWAELEDGARSDAFTVATLPARLAALGGRDPWDGYGSVRQSITAGMRSAVGLKEAA